MELLFGWSSTKNVDETINGIQLDIENGEINIINVSMPYCSKPNPDLYFQHLSKLDSFCESLNSSKICIVGNYNLNTTDAFGNLLEEFCNGYKMLSSSTVTYVSDPNNSMSWLDHCVASSAILETITCIAVLYGFVTSDHQPLAVLINTSGISRMDK